MYSRERGISSKLGEKMRWGCEENKPVNSIKKAFLKWEQKEIYGEIVQRDWGVCVELYFMKEAQCLKCKYSMCSVYKKSKKNIFSTMKGLCEGGSATRNRLFDIERVWWKKLQDNNWLLKSHKDQFPTKTPNLNFFLWQVGSHQNFSMIVNHTKQQQWTRWR